MLQKCTNMRPVRWDSSRYLFIDSSTSANCKGNHFITDKSCPHYIREAKLLKFKAEHHLSLSEVRLQFRMNTVSKSKSYAAIASTTSTWTITPTDYVTKTELQDSHQSFAESIAGMLEQVLDAQISKCQNMLNMVTTEVVGVMKEILTSDDPPPMLPPSAKKRRATMILTPRAAQVRQTQEIANGNND